MAHIYEKPDYIVFSIKEKDACTANLELTAKKESDHIMIQDFSMTCISVKITEIEWLIDRLRELKSIYDPS